MPSNVSTTHQYVTTSIEAELEFYSQAQLTNYIAGPEGRKLPATSPFSCALFHLQMRFLLCKLTEYRDYQVAALL